MILIKKVLRTIWTDKAPYLGSMFLIAFSCMLMVMMNLVSKNLNNTYSAYKSNHVMSDVEVYLDTELDMADMKKRFNVKIEQSGVTDYSSKDGQILRIFSFNTQINTPAVSSGKKLESGEILLDKLYAKKNGYEIGDIVQIAGKKYKYAGDMTLPNYIYVAKSKDEVIRDPKNFGLAVVDKDDFESIPNATPFYAIKFNNSNNLKAQETAMKGYLREKGTKIIKWENTEKNYSVSYVLVKINLMGKLSIVAPSMILLLTCVLTGILMWRLLNRESVIIGTLYAQGYRKKELMRHYLVFPLIVAGMGAMIGTIAGVFMINFLYNFMLTTFPMPKEPIVYDLGILMFSLLLPVVILCVSTIIVVNRMFKIRPSQLMKGNKKNDKANFIERKLRLDKFKFVTKFQIREQVRSLSRTIFLLFGIIVATMFLQYGLTMKSSVDYLLNEGISKLYHLKYEYVFNEYKRGAPPKGTEQFNTMYAIMDDEAETNFYITGLPKNSTRILLNDLKGNKLTPDKVIITTPLAKKMGLTIGDTIRFYNFEDGKKYSITIEEIADTYGGEFIFMPLSELNAMLDLPSDTYIGIFSDVEMTFAKKEIKTTKSMDAIKAGFHSLIDQMGIMIYSLTISAFVIGLVIIYLVTGLVVDEHKGTISLFKVLGYKKKEINKLILNSNIFTVIIGYILGVPLLVGSVDVMYQALAESLPMVIPAKLNIWYILLGFVIVMLTFELAKLMSRKKINRIAMSDALKSGTE
ncbi:putative ABC transport system permease protein [Seinonella peptonophila]|uniref:Putative ABC transport system permease protein n=1 Tax=Seinonella peptonophila TaxID=112248 RepID=A0A1M4X7T0_9BACL|nr:FtsX-like permease family protein [Seinonella peptonophila]SHE89501.1 putative ABC transport system permease protein [Seinonella peptonophila]